MRRRFLLFQILVFFLHEKFLARYRGHRETLNFRSWVRDGGDSRVLCIWAKLRGAVVSYGDGEAQRRELCSLFKNSSFRSTFRLINYYSSSKIVNASNTERGQKSTKGDRGGNKTVLEKNISLCLEWKPLDA